MKYISIKLFFFNLVIHLFLTALGFCCCEWAFSSCTEGGLSLVVVLKLNSCGSQAPEPELSSQSAWA